MMYDLPGWGSDILIYESYGEIVIKFEGLRDFYLFLVLN